MSDVFRKDNRQSLDEMRAQLIQKIKIKAEELYELFEYEAGREMAIAKTKLEESIMWAVKGITAKPMEPLAKPE